MRRAGKATTRMQSKLKFYEGEILSIIAGPNISLDLRVIYIKLYSSINTKYIEHWIAHQRQIIPQR